MYLTIQQSMYLSNYLLYVYLTFYLLSVSPFINFISEDTSDHRFLKLSRYPHDGFRLIINGNLSSNIMSPDPELIKGLKYIIYYISIYN